MWQFLLPLLVTPALSGDAVLRGKAGGSEIVVTTTSRLAGAIHSLTWNGREFIDSFDHGRQLQSAINLDCGKRLLAETYNPTEAGSRADGRGPTSSSKLLVLEVKGGREIRTRTQMAFWLRPGEKSEGNLAYNDRVLSNHVVSKRVRIGYRDLPHVLDYEVTFTIPADEKHHTHAVFEALTGYLHPDFSVFSRYDPKVGKLLPLDDGPGEQNRPIVFSTPDGKHAMGIFSPDQPSPGFAGVGYGRWRFGAEKVVKWNCVFRESARKGIVSGDRRYQMFVIVGTRDTCAQTMTRLHERFPREKKG